MFKEYLIDLYHSDVFRSNYLITSADLQLLTRKRKGGLKEIVFVGMSKISDYALPDIMTILSPNLSLDDMENNCMNRSIFLWCIIPAWLILLGGCGSRQADVRSLQYPPTEKVETVFQISRIPDSCRVFAHLFVTMPGGYTGKQFVEAVSEEAKSRGADIILVGHSRECTTGNELDFTYYGPDREYKIREWPAWSYGFEEWQEQGAWANIGYQEWGDSEIRYDFPILMQVVFVRCQ